MNTATHSNPGTPASADACTGAIPAITAESIDFFISECGDFATIDQILDDLGVYPATASDTLRERIRSHLVQAGWSRAKKHIDGMRVWGYMPPATRAPKPMAWVAYLKWSAQEFASADVRANSAHLNLVRAVTATRLGPYMEEIVQLAWAQLQAQESAVKTGGVAC